MKFVLWFRSESLLQDRFMWKVCEIESKCTQEKKRKTSDSLRAIISGMVWKQFPRFRWKFIRGSCDLKLDRFKNRLSILFLKKKKPHTKNLNVEGQIQSSLSNKFSLNCNVHFFFTWKQFKYAKKRDSIINFCPYLAIICFENFLNDFCAFFFRVFLLK